MLRLQAIGRLGKDAEVKEVNGKKVINFSIAVDTGYGDKKKTQWIECGKWGDNTAVAQYLKKGSQVHIDGEPSIREYETNANGKGYSLQLNISNITLVGSKQDSSQDTAPAAAGNAWDVRKEDKPKYIQTEIPDAESDGLPF